MTRTTARALILLLLVLAAAALWRLVIMPALFPPELVMPVLARDLPDTGASEAFAARIAATFPPGTPETDLIATLQAQSFSVLPDYQSARFEWKTFPCISVLLVTWQSQAGLLTRTDAARQRICP